MFLTRMYATAGMLGPPDARAGTSSSAFEPGLQAWKAYPVHRASGPSEFPNGWVLPLDYGRI